MRLLLVSNVDKFTMGLALTRNQARLRMRDNDLDRFACEGDGVRRV